MNSASEFQTNSQAVTITAFGKTLRPSGKDKQPVQSHKHRVDCRGCVPLLQQCIFPRGYGFSGDGLSLQPTVEIFYDPTVFFLCGLRAFFTDEPCFVTRDPVFCQIIVFHNILPFIIKEGVSAAVDAPSLYLILFFLSTLPLSNKRRLADIGEFYNLCIRILLKQRHRMVKPFIIELRWTAFTKVGRR